MNLFNFIRFKKRPPVKRPPPTNFVDAFYDPDAGAIKAIDSEGNTVSFNSNGGGDATFNDLTVTTILFTDSQAGVSSNTLALESGEFTVAISPMTLTASREHNQPDVDGVLAVVPAYVDLTAANAALSSGDYWWDTTLKKLRIATA